MKSIRAVFENGVFRPKEPVELAEHAEVELGDIRVIESSGNGSTQPIEDVLERLASEIPKEEWANLPDDLTEPR
jgi:predicted DNA-binding antitoxin AbrB/MazE fold protein